MSARAEETDRRGAQRETSMEAAAILLTLAMRDTEAPVAELGDALGRMRDALSPGHPARDDLFVCLRCLQFHDRLIQQIAAVRNLLATLGDHPLSDVSGFGAQRWEELLLALRERLTADTHHQLFDLLLRTGAIELDGRSGRERIEGSVELF